MIAASHDQKTLSGKGHAVVAACLSSFVMIVILLAPQMAPSLVDESNDFDDFSSSQNYSDPAFAELQDSRDGLLAVHNLD